MYPSAHKLAGGFVLFCFIKETLKDDTVFILLIGCIIELALCEVCVFDNEIIGCNGVQERNNDSPDLDTMHTITQRYNNKLCFNNNWINNTIRYYRHINWY